MSESVADTDTAGEAPEAVQQPLPDTLRSPRAKLVYLYLRTAGVSGMAELRRSLGMQALALYPVLETLVDAGLVDRVDDGYVATTSSEGGPDESER